MREVQVLSLRARTMKHPGANRAAVIEGGGRGAFCGNRLGAIICGFSDLRHSHEFFFQRTGSRTSQCHNQDISVTRL